MFGVLSVPGSSLHTRGTHDRAPRARQHARFIPAYAGNAWSRLPCGPGRSVHPRIRGERNPFSGAAAPARGSSPYTRGTPKRRRRVRTCPTVHPRMRGERTVAVMIRSAPYGSSPHTRGTRPPAARCGRASRFIPACAGNARRSPGPSGATSVHPRIRGERFLASRLDLGNGGSSPHTRGTLETLKGDDSKERFIPAYAGNAMLSTAHTRR